MLGYTLIALLIALMGTLVHALTPDIPLPTQRWGAVSLAAGPLIAALLSPLTRRSCWLSSAAKVATELSKELLNNGESQPPAKNRVAIALIDQSHLHGDGLSTLLQCNQSRLRTDSTTVICWSRGEDELALVHPRRLPGFGPSGHSALELIRHNELVERRTITSASIALRCGYPAIGLSGGASPEEVSKHLSTMISTLELTEAS
jgi:hypothetical protein